MLRSFLLNSPLPKTLQRRYSAKQLLKGVRLCLLWQRQKVPAAPRLPACRPKFHFGTRLRNIFLKNNSPDCFFTKNAPLWFKSFCRPKKTQTAASNLSFIWQGQKDLNPRHLVLETNALPTELYPYMRQKLLYIKIFKKSIFFS